MRARGTHNATGFTLIELLIVMSLVALLLGFGLGVFANIDVGSRVAVGSVQNVLRTAHNWAVARIAPSRVVIDAAAGTLRAEGHQVVGTWHFEEEAIKGAFGIDGVRFGGEIVPGGYQGHALSFVGQPARSHVELPLQNDPAFDLTHGFALRFALRPAEGAGGVLLDGGRVIGIETTGDGALKAYFVAQRAENEAASGRAARRRSGARVRRRDRAGGAPRGPARAVAVAERVPRHDRRARGVRRRGRRGHRAAEGRDAGEEDAA
jgi:prepilin-type N-terminal cleavage/methylation domain-containing protein